MRAVILSHLAADPEHRARYHALAAEGCQISVAVPSRWHPSHREEAFIADAGDDGRIRIVPIHVRGSLEYDIPARWNTRSLSRLLRDVRPDIIQIEEPVWSQGAAVATALAKRLGIPTVVTSDEAIAVRRPIMQRRYASQTLAGAGAGIATTSLAVRLLHRRRASLTVAVIPLRGVVPPLDPVRAPEDDAFHIGYVGRLVPERGIAVLFDACVRIHGRWSLTVIGSGPAQEELERRAERLGIAARVEWRGGLPRAAFAAIWPTLHCLTVPSKTTPGWIDTGAHAILDAMAHGVPVVASDTGALPDIIGTAGIIVPESDPDRLTDALKELMDEPARRHALGGLARQRILTEYTDTALARKTMRLWQDVAAKSAATP